MKKVVVFMIAMLYLGLTSGLAVNMHYCMGEIAGIKINDYKEESCKCGSKQKMACCNHQYYLVKVNDEHQQVACEIPVKPEVVALKSFENPLSALINSSLQLNKYNSESPPGLNGQGLCIRNCVFRV